MYQASSSSSPAPSSSAEPAPTAVQFAACAPADIDPSTAVCQHLVWVQQPFVLPPLDATAGVALSIAIITCWAIARVFADLQQVGDD